MVYCSKCGAENKEPAETCVKCGAKLKVPRAKTWEEQIEEGAEQFGRHAEEWGESFGKNIENECFGLPHGGTIIGVIIGFIIILLGIAWLAGISLPIWPLAIVIFGVLVLSGALYSLLRKR